MKKIKEFEEKIKEFEERKNKKTLNILDQKLWLNKMSNWVDMPMTIHVPPSIVYVATCMQRKISNFNWNVHLNGLKMQTV